ncbi:hypothetical protein WAI453_003086 [Rhynchosporium graminicola]
MEPYVSEEADEEARPEALASASEQASDRLYPPLPQPTPVSRREQTLPVRFASPIAILGEDSTRRRRPARQSSRDRSSERPGRGRSPFFGDRERQTSSPSSIRQSYPEETGRLYERFRARSLEDDDSPRRPSSPTEVCPNRPSRARTRDSQGDFLSEGDTVYMPSYFVSSRVAGEASELPHYSDEYDRSLPIRRAREDSYPESRYRNCGQPFARSSDSRAHSYVDDYEVEDWARPGRPEVGSGPRSQVEAVEPSYRLRPVPYQGAIRYDSDDEWDSKYRGPRDPHVKSNDRFSRPSRHRPPNREVRRSSYLVPTISSYRPGGYISPPRRRTTTYDDEDFLDIRRRRDRSPKYSDYRRNPFSFEPNEYYRPGDHDYRSWVPPPPPPPIILKKPGYHDAAGGDWEMSSSRRQLRSRSCSPPSPSAATPAIISTRIYNDREPDNVTFERVSKDIPGIYPSMYAERYRDQSRSKFPSVRSVPIHSRVSNHYYSEDYDPLPGDLSEPDLGYSQEAYRFTLSRHSKSLRGTDSLLSSASDISDPSEKDEPNSGSSPKSESQSGTTYHVLQSQYIGDGVIGGSHAVQLTLNPDPSPKDSKGAASVFRWVHFEDQSMDFENFEHNALTIPKLTDNETTAIAKILRRAKKVYDKPLQTATKGRTRFMVPSFIQENLAEEKKSTSAKARSISWMCAPYFCLAKYGTISGLKPTSHPMRTLLQARFALVQKGRDMKQAVCYLQDTLPEHCFHIAQVWFLILDDSLVVSCARISMKAVQGDCISILPNPDARPALACISILVSTKNSLLWALPLKECQSWFGFVSHFSEFWPLKVEVTYKEKPITASEWPRILTIAKKTTLRLLVDFQTPKQSEPAKGVLLYEESLTDDAEGNLEVPEIGSSSTPEPLLRPTDQRRSSRSKKQSIDQSKEEFRVFTWINSRNASRDVGSPVTAVNVDYVLTGFESQGVDDDLAEIDTYLSSKTDISHRLTYNRCQSTQSSERSELYVLLSGLKPDALSAEETVITTYENLVGVLNAAELLFRFFLPPGSQAPTTSKYWGALSMLLKSITDANPGRSRGTPNRYTQADFTASALLNWLELLNKVTSPFKDYLDHVPLPDRSDIKMPEELTIAWLHLVLALTFSAEDTGLFETQMSICHDLVIRGTRKAISGLSKANLFDYAVFQPFEFASLIAFQLSQEHKGSAADVSDTYLEYLKTLQSDIEGNPLDRNHQDRIVCLKQEIEVISETLDAQQYILRQAQRGFNTSRGNAREDLEYPDAGYARRSAARTKGHIMHTDSAGVQSLIIQDNLALVENRIRGFREMREIASELGEWNIQKIDSNKDRQEAAIYAFTIVTIIFLPLGTVAGIMGMNTSDVRDMPYAQWVYWATALPLTILVITLCLAWAGELNNFQEGFKNLWRRNPRNYVMVKDRYESAGTGRRDRYDEPVYNAPLRRSRTIYGSKESYV